MLWAQHSRAGLDTVPTSSHSRGRGWFGWGNLRGGLDRATGPSYRPLGVFWIFSPALCHWAGTRQVRNPSEGSLGAAQTCCAINPRNATALCGFFIQVLQHLTCFLHFQKPQRKEERWRSEERRRKIEAVCFLHRFTAPSASHDTCEVLDMVSLHFTHVRLLEGFSRACSRRELVSVATQDTGQSSCLGQLTRFICSFFSCQVNTLSFMSTSWVGPCLEKSLCTDRPGLAKGRGGRGGAFRGVTENSATATAKRGSCSEEGPGGQSLVPALLHGPSISVPRPPTLPTPILQPLELCGSPPLTQEPNPQFQAEVTKRGMFHPFLLVCTGAFQGALPSLIHNQYLFL